METAADSSGFDSVVYLLSRCTVLAFVVMSAPILLRKGAKLTIAKRGWGLSLPRAQVAKPTSLVQAHWLSAFAKVVLGREEPFAEHVL